MEKIKKNKTKVSSEGIVKRPPQENFLRFSFKFFDNDDVVVCPKNFPNGYVQTLALRLKELEGWTTADFQTKKNKTLRNHSHDWAKTARPSGFSTLPSEWKGHQAWQFCLSANEHGGVHGIISGDTFYVVWLDANHALYP